MTITIASQGLLSYWTPATPVQCSIREFTQTYVCFRLFVRLITPKIDHLPFLADQMNVSDQCFETIDTFLVYRCRAILYQVEQHFRLIRFLIFWLASQFECWEFMRSSNVSINDIGSLNSKYQISHCRINKAITAHGTA